MKNKKPTTHLKNVATAQYDFAQLRENDDYVYVDKTDMLEGDIDALICETLYRKIEKSKNRKIDESKNNLGRHQV